MRILVATVTAGGGHVQAAALEEAWKAACPDDEVKRVDLMDLVPRLQRRVYAEGYVKLVEHAPELWRVFSDAATLPAKLTV